MASGVPPMTHRYLVEHISKAPHVKTMLASRYAKLQARGGSPLQLWRQQDCDGQESLQVKEGDHPI